MTLKSRPLHLYGIVDQASKAGTCILKAPKSLKFGDSQPLLISTTYWRSFVSRALIWLAPVYLIMSLMACQ